jgi:hypothetical protein
MHDVKDPSEILAGRKAYTTCGDTDCDALVLAWLGVDMNDVDSVRMVRNLPVDGRMVSCVPLVVPQGADMFCAVCGMFVMHGIACRDTEDHPGTGAPHPDFADLI